jgi:hypothetical protein
MNSSNPGAEKMKIAVIASVPMLVTEMAGDEGANRAAPMPTALPLPPCSRFL